MSLLKLKLNEQLLDAAKQGNFNEAVGLVNQGADVNATDENARTPLHWAYYTLRWDIAQYLVGKGSNVNAKDSNGKTPLDLAVVQYSEVKLSENGEVPSQRKRRHHHGDHNRHHSHLSRKPLAIDSGDQPGTASSSAARPSSWINGLFGWAKNSIGGLFYSRAALPEETLNTTNSISQVDLQMDVDGIIIFFDFLARKLTGRKYISTVDQSISSLEAEGYALNIMDGFRKVVEQAALKHGIGMHRLNINYVEIQKEVAGKIMGGKFDEISSVLKFNVEKACPGREAGCPGRLGQKKFDNFIVEFDSRLNIVLHQAIQQVLHNGNSGLGGSDEQINSGPKSYLNNTFVQAHLTQDRGLRLR